jgi:hypothetical protein
MRLIIQTALHQRLTQDAALAALVKGIHDEIPQALTEEEIPGDEYLPCIVWGDDKMQAYDTDGYLGYELYFNLHTWSKYKGRKELIAIHQRIKDLLHRYEFPIAGHTKPNIILITDDLSRAQDGKTRFGVLQFKLTTIETGV